MRRPAAAAAARLLAMLGLAVALAHLHPRHRPATVCLLRAVTGVPCPFCGGTTAAARIGRGNIAGALRASPLAVVAAPLIAALPLVGSRLARTPSYARLIALGAALGGSELWQLHRFGWL